MVVNKWFDVNKFVATIKHAVRFLDNIITINSFPLEEIREATLRNRKIGLGIMGFADALIKLDIPYDSIQALKFATEIVEYLNGVAFTASKDLATEKGPYSPGARVRNATRTSIAPTGTISMLANCSSGIEPIFGVGFTKSTSVGNFKVINPLFEEHLSSLGPSGVLSDAQLNTVYRTGSIQGLALPKETRDLFKTSTEINVDTHINMQSTFQKHIDLGCSKTINLPSTATKEDVKRAFMTAHAGKCKGITVYRDGSREGQVIQTESTFVSPPKENAKPEVIVPKETRKRPDCTYGVTRRIPIACGTLFATINSDPTGICEVFVNGRGGCRAQTEAMARLASIALRSNVPVEKITDQLKGIPCPAAMKAQLGVMSCPDALARAISEYGKLFKDYGLSIPEDKPTVESTVKVDTTSSCPECGEPMKLDSGCRTCRSCGYSKCG